MQQEQLTLDSALFRKLLDAAPDATVIVDDTAVIVLANHRVETLFGWTRAELVGVEIEALVPDGLDETGGELVVLHKDGREVPVEISLSPLETEYGVLVSASIRDITDRLRIQAEAERIREELIATVSHELRTPLTSIIGYTELLGDLPPGELGDRARQLIAVIERNAGRELRLVDDLLTMAFLDGNRLRISLATIDLAEVARRVVGDQVLKARDAGVELSFEGAEIPAVSGDFYRLVQVVENLVTNAVKFTSAGGSVRVRVGSEDGRGVIDVVDTGMGVSPAEKLRLFERLYRTPGAVAAHVQGAGLGLPIVQKIVQAHGGRVDVESEEGVGTTFRIAIPYAERPAWSSRSEGCR